MTQVVMVAAVIFSAHIFFGVAAYAVLMGYLLVWS